MEEFQLAPGFEERLDCTKQILIYHSKEDPYVPFNHYQVYKKHLPFATVRTFEDAGSEMVRAVSKMVEDIRRLRLKHKLKKTWLFLVIGKEIPAALPEKEYLLN